MARKIEIEVVGDTSSLEKALSRAQGKSTSAFSKIGKAAKTAGLALGGVLAAGAVVGFKELMESQKVAAQTTAVLKSTGGAANKTAAEIEGLASSLSKMSGVDDEAIQSSENLLLTFTNVRNEAGKGMKVFDQATAAILDMSVAMGTDLQSATIQVGKALNDPIKGITALTRVGVTFTDEQKKLIEKLVETGNTAHAQQVILTELNKEFGGSAKAAGETLPGQLNKLKNSFEETAGTLVEALLPAIEKILGNLTRFAEWAQKNPQQMKLVVVGLAALAAALVTASIAQTALNLAVLANPYVAAVVGVVALTAAIIVLVKKVDFFREHWQLLLAPLGLLAVIVGTVVKAVVRHFDTLKAAFEKVRTVARIAFAAAAASVRLLLGPILLAIAAAQRLADALNAIPDFVGAGGPIAGGGGGSGVPVGRGARPPGNALGGRVMRSGAAIIHSGEMITPARVARGQGGAPTWGVVYAYPDFWRWFENEQGKRRRAGYAT